MASMFSFVAPKSMLQPLPWEAATDSFPTSVFATGSSSSQQRGTTGCSGVMGGSWGMASLKVCYGLQGGTVPPSGPSDLGSPYPAQEGTYFQGTCLQKGLLPGGGCFGLRVTGLEESALVVMQGLWHRLHGFWSEQGSAGHSGQVGQYRSQDRY